MKPKCRNDRFNQQHKIYEQGRRTQIAQLISSLHACLPREHKPKKDKHTEVLSSALNYIQLLQKRTDDINATVVPEDVRKESEKLKAYVADLEERCNRYAELLGLKGAGKSQSVPASAESGLKTPAAVPPGSVSIIAASAPLVFLVSQQQSPGTKVLVDASTSTVPAESPAGLSTPDLLGSAILVVTDGMRQDAWTTMDEKSLAESGAQTEGILNLDRIMVTAEIQVGSTDSIDRGCSPVVFASSVPLHAVENSKKRQSDGLEIAGGPSEAANKSKRRRSDGSAPTISEIIDLVAANELGESGRTANTDAACTSGKGPAEPRAEREGASVSSMSVTALLQQQNFSKESGQQRPLGAVVATTATSETVTQSAIPQPIVSTTLAWCNFAMPDSGQQPFTSRSSSQSRQLQQQQPPSQQRQQQPPSQQQQQQQQQHSSARDGRQQQGGAPVYQGNPTERNQANYAALSESQAPASARMNENCKNSSSSSRRGANFSVEFLHGGGTSVSSSERLQQQDVQSQQRQNPHRSHSTATSQQYRLEEEGHTPSSVANYGYYDLHHGSYTNSGNQWTARDHSWSSEPSYQWWTNQGPPASFTQPPSIGQARQLSTANTISAASSKSGLATSSASKQSSSGQSSSSRPMHEEANCINLSNSVFDSAASCSVSMATTSLTTSVSSWAIGSQSYAAGNRFAYCAAPTLFTDPSSLSYVRQDGSARKSLSTSTAAPALNVTTLASAACPSYSHYWSSGDWTSSAFATSSSSAATFGLSDHSHGQHQNHGKAQNFQIATMFPEASSSGSTAGGASWRAMDGYRNQEHGQHADVMFGSGRMTTSTANSYMMQPPSYRQATADSTCLPRFS